MIVSNLLNKIQLKRKKKQLLSKAIVGSIQDNLFCKTCSSISLTDGSKPEDIKIGNKVWMWGHLSSQTGGKIVLGNYVKIGAGCVVDAVESISIGDYTAIAVDAHISDNNNHPVNPSYRKYMRIKGDDESRLWKHSAHAPVVIGENCWIGRNVSIMKGVTIGDNCVIAANSVITKSIPANCIAAGNPAKVVKTDIENIPAPTSCEGYNEYIRSNK
jgi:acetyltransferase-like isoleucine patch superfamily enzyme